MDRLQIIKVGGNVIDDPQMLTSFLQTFSEIKGPKLLVHGGGKEATKLMKDMGLEPKMVDGRRITDEDALKVVTMVYGGLINKNIVATLQSLNCNALGLSGADANCLPAQKRPVKDIDYGWVGDPVVEQVNTSFIQSVIQQDIAPVFCALTHDGAGHILNTNADTIASTLAIALSKVFEVSLVYVFEKNGVLRDINDDDSYIQQINREEYQQLVENGVIFEGMLPKMKNAFDAIAQGVHEVVLCSPLNINNPNVRTVLCEQ